MRLLLPLLLAGPATAPALATPPPAAVQVVDLPIEKLTSVDWVDGRDLPEEIRALHGREVVLKGYMRADRFTDLEEFLMVAAECQCAGRPEVQHFVDVRLSDDRVDLRTSSIEIRGTLFVGPRRDDDGYVTSLYRLRRASVY